MKRILFVCVENSCRSQMAEAFARLHGKPNEFEIYSAGSRPSGQVNSKAITSMREINYDLTTRHQSKSLTDVPAVAYDAVVTMGCGDECPFVGAKRREDWNIPDPKDDVTGRISPRAGNDRNEGERAFARLGTGLTKKIDRV